MVSGGTALPRRARQRSGGAGLDAGVARYLPELKQSGFGDATVEQVLDMTTGVKFIEDYADPASDYFPYRSVHQPFLRPANYQGPDHIYAYLATLEKKTEHGAAFKYRSVHTDVLGWILTRVTGKKPAELLSERIWAPMGAEDDASLRVGPAGIQMPAGGWSCRLRDLARFGEMIRLRGRFNGRQVIPAAAVAEASYPLAANANLDATTLPAYHALALHLMAHPR